MQEMIVQAGEDPLFLRPADVQRHLNLSKPMVYAMIAAGEIPGSTHFGRSVRVHAPSFFKWAAERAAAPDEDRR
jgi:excisionase family DNA binding protein